MNFPQKVCYSQEKTVEKKCNQFFDISYQKSAATIQSTAAMTYGFCSNFQQCGCCRAISNTKSGHFFSLIFIIMGIRLKFFSKSYLKHWNTPMQVPHRLELQNMKIMKTLDGRGNFLVIDIKKPIALLFHSFFLATTYSLGKIHGQTKPNQIWSFSEIGMFI